MSRIVTKADLVEALRKNGYRQITGHMVKYDPWAKELTACAMGQAAINLKIIPNRLDRVLSGVVVFGTRSLSGWIIDLNDSVGLDIQEIADKVEAEAPDFSINLERQDWNVEKFMSQFDLASDG